MEKLEIATTFYNLNFSVGQKLNGCSKILQISTNKIHGSLKHFPTSIFTICNIYRMEHNDSLTRKCVIIIDV